MEWDELLGLVSEACQAGEREVLLVLSDATYRVREVVSASPGTTGLLGFVVDRDDPERATQSGTALLFVPQARVERLLIRGGGEGRLGFER